MSEAAMTTTWQPRSAWAGFAKAGRHGRTQGEAGIRLTLRDNIGLAIVIAVEGQEDRLAGLLADRFGWNLPEIGEARLTGERGLIWSAPGQWLVIAETRAELSGLAEALCDVAAVTDQSDARAIVRVTGPHAREALAKGLAIDLHPSAFHAGRAAVTSIAHIGAQVWQRDDAPTYELSVARSFAGSFWGWLGHACEEFGYEVESG